MYRNGVINTNDQIGPLGPVGPPGPLVKTDMEKFIKYALVSVKSEIDPDLGYTKGKMYTLIPLNESMGYFICDDMMKPIFLTKQNYDKNFGNLEDLRDLAINKIIND